MAYDDDNVFAKILRGDLHADRVYEDETALAFRDVNPLAPTHVLVVPKRHVCEYTDFVKDSSVEEISEFFNSVLATVDVLNLAESGYRLIVNSGRNARQEVPHFHVHILGGRDLGTLSEAFGRPSDVTEGRS